MKSQLIQSGLSIANYLQTAFPETPKQDGIYNTDRFHKPNINQPPSLLKGFFDSGRPYFKLDYADFLNNLLCLLFPIGKVRVLVSDLYVPVVSVCTFLLLASQVLLISKVPRLSLNDALSRTLTKVILTYVVELIILSGVIYASFSSYSDNYSHNTPQSVNIAFAYPQSKNISTDSQFVPGMDLHGVNNSHFGSNNYQMKDPLYEGGSNWINVIERLLIIGYKYLALDLYILVGLLLPLKIVRISLLFYTMVICVLFTLRSMVQLLSNQSARGTSPHNPLIFIFPILQPLFCYVLIPTLY